MIRSMSFTNAFWIGLPVGLLFSAFQAIQTSSGCVSIDNESVASRDASRVGSLMLVVAVARVAVQLKFVRTLR